MMITQYAFDNALNATVIKTLSPRELYVAKLLGCDGLSYKQVAQYMNCSEKTVQGIVTKIVKKYARHFEFPSHINSFNIIKPMIACYLHGKIDTEYI